MSEGEPTRRVRAVYREARELNENSPTLVRLIAELRERLGIVSPDGSITREELAWAAGQLGLAEGQRVLDAASGSAAVLLALAQERGCAGVGMDLLYNRVKAGLEAARGQGLAVRVGLVQADATHPLPFPAATFDALLLLDALIHFEDKRALFREMRRVLRPRARVLVLTVVGDDLSEQEAQVLEETTATLFRLNQSELLRLFQEEGMSVEAERNRTGQLLEWHGERAAALRGAEQTLREELGQEGWETVISRAETMAGLLRRGALRSLLLVAKCGA